MRIFPALTIVAVIGLPVAFVVGGLWVGLGALHLSQWWAALGLLEARPLWSNPVMRLAGWALRGLSVLGYGLWLIG